MIIPPYLSSMIRREPPVKELIVEGSTPVIYFGDFRSARVATLGINPSNREFEEDSELLKGDRRRLSTLESLGANSLESLTEEQVHQVVQDCDNYFQNPNYYRGWFDQIEAVIKPGLGVSFFDGSACHLDLVQWATSGKWGNLEPKDKSRLLDEGRNHLLNLLKNSQISLVIVNGKSVWNELKSAGFGAEKNIGTLTFGKSKTTCQLLINKSEKLVFLGWSSNIPSQQGTKNDEFKRDLAKWLRDLTKWLEDQNGSEL